MNPLKEQFDDLFQFACKQLEQRLSERPKTVMPMLFIGTMHPDGHKGIVMVALDVDFNEPEEKQKTMRGVGKMLCEKDELPLAVVMICEAWISVQTAGALHIEPRKDPNRREVVHAVGVSGDRKLCAHQYQCVRRTEGFMVPEGPPVRSDNMVAAPIFDHLFQGWALAKVAGK